MVSGISGLWGQGGPRTAELSVRCRCPPAAAFDPHHPKSKGSAFVRREALKSPKMGHRGGDWPLSTGPAPLSLLFYFLLPN